MKKIKYYSYQDPQGVNYINAQIGDKSIILRKKSFTSLGLKVAAKLERGKRNLQNKVEDVFGVGKIIDPKTGKPVIQDAKKRKLIEQGVKPVLPEQTAPKTTEIGKDGQVDFVGASKRAWRKAKPLIGKGINAGIDIAENIAYPAVGMITTPGRTLSKGISKTIENPAAAATYGLSYAAPFMGAPGRVIMAVDNMVPNPLQYKAIDRMTPRPIRTRLKQASDRFNNGAGKRMRSFQWADAIRVAGAHAPGSIMAS